MSDVYEIVCNHKGNTHEVLFYPAGNGAYFDGYVTCIQQLEQELHDAFAISRGALAYISNNGVRKDINNDSQLVAAVENLTSGSTLSITFVEANKQGKGRKGKNKKNTNKQATSDSSSSSSSSEEVSASQDSDLVPAKQKNNKKKTNNKQKSDHSNNQCHHCNAFYWSGNRYRYFKHHGYSLCNSCYEQLDKDDKKTWELVSGRSKGKDKKKNNSTSGDEPNILKIMERFVYQSADCYYCDASNWWGARYQYCDNPHHYSLCASCYQALDDDDDTKKMWELSPLPWDEYVPEAPLKREEGVPIREEVRHLQYILTALGEMKLENTDQVAGSYQYHTEMAVQAFRNKHNVKGCNNTKCYDKPTSKKLREVVIKARKHGN